MPVGAAEVAVLIVGGGPVGLAARALLTRWGVDSLLVEKRRELSPFPRSRLVNVRSMEIFGQLGLAAEVEGRAFGPEYGRIRFRDTLLDRDFAVAEMVGVNAAITESPVTGAVISQDRLEPVLLAASNAEVRFGVELVDLSEEPTRVVATLVDHESGGISRVRARYVIAADGAGSTVRELLGIRLTGPGTMGSFTTVVFDAALDRWRADRPAGVYFTTTGSFGPLYPEGGWAWFVPTPDDADRSNWRELLVRALGHDVEVVVRRVQQWTMTASIAERFRAGRVLVAGDAAHAVPIVGGLGMNAGIADVHNVCWKLAGIIHGWAGPGVLDTYEPERKPVAAETLQQAMANTRLVLDVLGRRREQQTTGVAPDVIELPWTDRYFAQLGLVLGVAYESGAVVADGSAPPARSDPVTDYVPTGRPGHRMPHLQLKDGRSSLDTLGEWFTLLTPDPDQWGRLPAKPWPLRIEALSAEHADRCGLGPRGAVLVRPDHHIGARWHDGPPTPTAVQHALAEISGSAASPTLLQRSR